jgi:signal transduction histidine kinase
LIGELFDELSESADEKVIAKNQRLDFHAKSSARLKTDKLLLWRILENLLSNAIKYSPEGKSIHISSKEENERTIFVIKDEGPGFSEDDKKKMFGKFQKLSARPTGNENSTGLGLSIVKMIVEKLMGSIQVESEQGKGSTFIVSLPNLDQS